jgi:hypothetical protein
VPAVSPLQARSARIEWKAVLHDPGRFNQKGGFIAAFTGYSRGADVIIETAADGTTVWECRLPPVGSLTAFARAADGITVVAQCAPGRFSRILRIGRNGEFRGGVSLSSKSSDDGPSRVETLQVEKDGGIFASTSGYAFWTDAKGKLKREWIHRSLRAAAAFPDGSLICALRDPARFAFYDRATGTLAGIPQDAFCHIWSADRAEALEGGRFRLYGCFCFTVPAAERGGKSDRKTLEVIETDLTGAIAWSYGSPYAVRVDEFGTQKCVTYTRQVFKRSDGKRIILNAYQPDCQAAELDDAGAPGRIILTVPSIPDPVAPELSVCPLIRAQVIE